MMIYYQLPHSKVQFVLVRIDLVRQVSLSLLFNIILRYFKSWFFNKKVYSLICAAIIFNMYSLKLSIYYKKKRNSNLFFCRICSLLLLSINHLTKEPWFCILLIFTLCNVLNSLLTNFDLSYFFWPILRNLIDNWPEII